MTSEPFDCLNHRPPPPAGRELGIGAVGAGFIMRDCHLPAYAAAGYRVVGITSRSLDRARETAAINRIARVHDSLEELLADPEVEVVDIAVPPADQPAMIERVLSQGGSRVRGILAQKPLALDIGTARRLVAACGASGVALQVNQNMRYDHSARALKTLIERGDLGEPILATIELRAIPHWMPWAQGGRSLTTMIMSIHHLDVFRYWLGDPERVMASSRPDPRTQFAHDDGINLYVLEFPSGARASGWDDVWSGPSREGSAGESFVRWRFEGTRGMAVGEIGWPGWPERVPSTIDYTIADGRREWRRPRWSEAWFPDAFAGTMGGLLDALANGTEPDIPGRDNLKTIALCEAVLASSREHRVTRLDEYDGSMIERRGDDTP